VALPVLKFPYSVNGKIFTVGSVRIAASATSLLVVLTVLEKYGPEAVGYYFLFSLYRLSGTLAPVLEASSEQLLNYFLFSKKYRIGVVRKIFKVSTVIVVLVGLPLTYLIQWVFTEIPDDSTKKYLIICAIMVWPLEMTAELTNIFQRIHGRFLSSASFPLFVQLIGIVGFLLSDTMEQGFFAYTVGIALCVLLQWIIVFKKVESFAVQDTRRVMSIFYLSHRRNFNKWIYSIFRSTVVLSERWAAALLFPVAMFGLYGLLSRVVGVLKMLFPSSAQISWFYSNSSHETFRLQFRRYQLVCYCLWLIAALILLVVDIKFEIKGFELESKDIVAATLFIPLMIYTSATMVDVWVVGRHIKLISVALSALTCVKLVGIWLIAPLGQIAYVFCVINLITILYLLFIDKVLDSQALSVRTLILTRRELYYSAALILFLVFILDLF